jgi:hypothetical protein
MMSEDYTMYHKLAQKNKILSGSFSTILTTRLVGQFWLKKPR